MRSIRWLFAVALLLIPGAGWSGIIEQDILKSCQQSVSISDESSEGPRDSTWKFDPSTFCVCMSTKIAGSDVIALDTKQRLADRWPGSKNTESSMEKPAFDTQAVKQYREIVGFQANCLRASARLPFSPYEAFRGKY